MKLYWKLHETTELHTDRTLEDAEKTMRSAVGVQFHGKADGDEWALTHHDRNIFRPSLRLKMNTEEDGTLICAAYRIDKTLLIFMCVWTVIVIGLAIWRNPLLLLTLLLFWGAVLIGFSIGVKASNRDLMALFEAYEIL